MKQIIWPTNQRVQHHSWGHKRNQSHADVCVIFMSKISTIFYGDKSQIPQTKDRMYLYQILLQVSLYTLVLQYYMTLNTTKIISFFLSEQRLQVDSFLVPTTKSTTYFFICFVKWDPPMERPVGEIATKWIIVFVRSVQCEYCQCVGRKQPRLLPD